MKKLIWTVLCVLLTAALLAGCGGSGPEAASSSEAAELPAQKSEVSQTQTAGEPSGTPLDHDTLMDIALNDVGIDFTECSKMALRESGDEITVSFFYNGYDYAYIINMYTGEILDSSKAASDEPIPLDFDTLMDIALGEAGIDITECSDLKISKSGDEVTVTFNYGGQSYAYVLDRYSGEVLDSSKTEVVGGTSAGEPLSSQQIMDIASDACGQSLQGVENIHIASKGGVSTVTFTLPSGDYCYVIDEQTGEILESQTP